MRADCVYDNEAAGVSEMKIRTARAWVGFCCVVFLAAYSVHAEDVLTTIAGKRLAALTPEDKLNVDSPDHVSKSIRVQRLRCEYRDRPLGIDHPAPRLSWTLESPVRGQKQTAYCFWLLAVLKPCTPVVVISGTVAKWSRAKA